MTWQRVCCLDDLGLAVTGRRLEPDGAVLARKVLDADRWCRRCGGEGVPRSSVVRTLTYDPLSASSGPAASDHNYTLIREEPSSPCCPVPEVARLGKTLRTWRAAFLAYFATGGASNGGTEAVNGLI